MNSANKRPQLFLAGIILAYVIGKIVLLTLYHDIRWDEAVYLNMAKSVLGNGGFWEALRPPLWPLLLSVFMLLGDAVLLGELFVATLSVVAAVILYLTLKRHTSNWIAAIASSLLLATDIWFTYSSMLLTGVISASLLIIAFYLHSKHKYFWAGFVSALAFLTRFPAGMGFGALFLSNTYYLWVQRARLLKKTFHPLFFLTLGFAIPTFLWMISNAIQFSHRLFHISLVLPLLQGSGNVFLQNTWLHNTQVLYYFSAIATTIPICILAVFGFRKLTEDSTQLAYAILTVLTLIFFTVLPNNQWRFALLIIPGLLVLTARGIHYLQEKNIYAGYFVIAVALLNIGFLAVHDYNLLSHRGPTPPEIETDYYQFLQEHPVNGTIYVSDPIAAYYSPNDAIPIYYEFLKDVDVLIQQEAAAVFYVPRSVPCHPQDIECQENTQQFTDHLVDEYALVHISELHGFRYFIFSNQIDLPEIDESAVYAELDHVSATIYP